MEERRDTRLTVTVLGFCVLVVGLFPKDLLSPRVSFKLSTEGQLAPALKRHEAGAF